MLIAECSSDERFCLLVDGNGGARVLQEENGLENWKAKAACFVLALLTNKCSGRGAGSYLGTAESPSSLCCLVVDQWKSAVGEG